MSKLQLSGNRNGYCLCALCINSLLQLVVDVHGSAELC